MLVHLFDSGKSNQTRKQWSRLLFQASDLITSMNENCKFLEYTRLSAFKVSGLSEMKTATGSLPPGLDSATDSHSCSYSCGVTGSECALLQVKENEPFSFRMVHSA